MLWTLLSGINVDWIGLDYFYCPSPDFSTSIVSQSVTNNRCAPSCGGCTREKWGGTSKNFQPALRAGIVPPTSKLLPTPLRNIVLWSVPPSFCAALFINNEPFTLADLTADKQAWRGPANFYWAICWPTQKKRRPVSQREQAHEKLQCWFVAPTCRLTKIFIELTCWPERFTSVTLVSQQIGQCEHCTIMLLLISE